MESSTCTEPKNWAESYSKEGIRRYGVSLGKKIAQDDCAGLAAEMSYHIIVSLIPTLLFFTSLAGWLGGQKQIYPMIHDFITRFAPPPSVNLLNETVEAVINGSSTGLTAIGLLGTLFSATGAASVLVKGLQRFYGLNIDNFPFWYRPWLSLSIVLSFGLITTLATSLIMFGNFIVSIWPASTQFPTLFWALRWLIALLGMRYGVSLAYTMILRPQINRMAWKEARFGSWFFVFTWLLGSWLFSAYVSRLPQFNPVYGSVGILIILVTWFYFSSFVFFIGGEVTAMNAGLRANVSKLAN